jgi:predicted dehydrogenase
MDALCMVAGELAEVSAEVSTQVPQWFERDTNRYVDVTSPDNVLLAGRLENGAVVSVHLGINPYHGSGFRLEIYGKEGTLMMLGGGEAGQEAKRQIVGGRKDDKALTDLPVPERYKWVPEEVRGLGQGYDVGQMWVQFAEAIRGGGSVEADFDHAVRRHRMLDAIRRAGETGQRQKVQ